MLAVHGEEGGVKRGDVDELPEALRRVVEARWPPPRILGHHVLAADEVGPKLLRALRLGEPAPQADPGHLSEHGGAAAHTSALARGDSAIASCEATARGPQKSLWVRPAFPSA